MNPTWAKRPQLPLDAFALASAIDETIIVDGDNGTSLAPLILHALNRRGWFLVTAPEQPATEAGLLWADLDAESMKSGPTMTITKAQYLALREARLHPTDPGENK